MHMDPDANLAEQRAIFARINAPGHEPGYQGAHADVWRLAELAQALDEWLTRGGVLPRQWTRPRYERAL
jgi:hypothetical protein